jgi:hypothetical protein
VIALPIVFSNEGGEGGGGGNSAYVNASCQLDSDLSKLPGFLISLNNVTISNKQSHSESYREYTSQYLVHIWIVMILSLAAFIKFYYLYKAVLLVVIFAIYSVLILTIMKWTSGM